MTYMNPVARRQGFTLIELLIVIVIIAILALIVIPRIAQANLRAKEATFQSNLHQIRTAIETFHADTGAYPKQLADIVATTAPTEGYDDQLNNISVSVANYHGPYLLPVGGIDAAPGIPLNPLSSAGASGTIDEHWTYPVATATGKITGAVGGLSTTGIDYRAY